MGPLLEGKRKKYEEQPLCSSFRQFEKKEIEDPLITRNFQTKGSKMCFFVICHLEPSCI